MSTQPQVPVSADPATILSFLRDFVGWSKREYAKYVPLRTAVDSILLQSSGNKVYQITVTDAGVITATLVKG